MKPITPIRIPIDRSLRDASRRARPRRAPSAVVVALACAACLLGCAGSIQDTTPSPSASASATPPVPTPASSDPSPSTPEADVAAAIEHVRERVRAWNAALNRRDVEGLRPFYAAHVRWYGAEWAAETDKVIQDQYTWLRDAPTVDVVLIEPIAVVHEGGADFTARFYRRTTASTRDEEFVRLRFRAQEDGRLAIMAEWTELVEDTRLDYVIGDTRCFAAAAAAVHTVPAVLAAEEHAAREAAASQGRFEFGGIGPRQVEPGRFLLRIGVDQHQKLDARVVYVVERKTGSVALRVEGEELGVGGEAEAKVREACALR